MRKRRQGFSMFASYSEMCEAFGGRGYNFTARCEGAQLALSSQEARQSDACPEHLDLLGTNSVEGFQSQRKNGGDCFASLAMTLRGGHRCIRMELVP